MIYIYIIIYIIYIIYIKYITYITYIIYIIYYIYILLYIYIVHVHPHIPMYIPTPMISQDLFIIYPRFLAQRPMGPIDPDMKKTPGAPPQQHFWMCPWPPEPIEAPWD